jgi:hypothetical protein
MGTPPGPDCPTARLRRSRNRLRQPFPSHPPTHTTTLVADMQRSGVNTADCPAGHPPKTGLGLREAAPPGCHSCKCLLLASARIRRLLSPNSFLYTILQPWEGLGGRALSVYATRDLPWHCTCLAGTPDRPPAAWLALGPSEGAMWCCYRVKWVAPGRRACKTLAWLPPPPAAAPACRRSRHPPLPGLALACSPASVFAPCSCTGNVVLVIPGH